METPGFGSPLQMYRDTTHRMQVSNDHEGSDPTYLGSLGVVDLYYGGFVVVTRHLWTTGI